MKNLLISSLVLFLISFSAPSIAQSSNNKASACNLQMNVSSNTCRDNGSTRRIVFTVNSGSADIQIYSNGSLAAEGNNTTTTVLYFPTKSYPYTVLIECQSSCRRDGCIVVIEPC